MRVFKNGRFKRFAKRANISDETLLDVISQLNEGEIDADLGGHVIKQRIARTGQGKSGGYRTIIVFKKDDRAFFVYGFAKKDKSNLAPDELKTYKTAAKYLLRLTDEQIVELIKNGTFTEVELPTKVEPPTEVER